MDSKATITIITGRGKTSELRRAAVKARANGVPVINDVIHTEKNDVDLNHIIESAPFGAMILLDEGVLHDVDRIKRATTDRTDLHVMVACSTADEERRKTRV